MAWGIGIFQARWPTGGFSADFPATNPQFPAFQCLRSRRTEVLYGPLTDHQRRAVGVSRANGLESFAQPPDDLATGQGTRALGRGVPRGDNS